MTLDSIDFLARYAWPFLVIPEPDPQVMAQISRPTTLAYDGLSDTVLMRVRVLGEGKVCHTGSRSCFTKKLELAAALALEMDALS